MGRDELPQIAAVGGFRDTAVPGRIANNTTTLLPRNSRDGEFSINFYPRRRGSRIGATTLTLPGNPGGSDRPPMLSPRIIGLSIATSLVAFPIHNILDRSIAASKVASNLVKQVVAAIQFSLGPVFASL